jgi:hypothetical protein
MLLQWFSLLDCFIERKSDRPQFGIKDLHPSSA